MTDSMFIKGHSHVPGARRVALQEPGKSREVDPNKGRLHAELKFSLTGVCMDFCCEKNHYAHLDTYESDEEDNRAQAQYVQCGVCNDVYRLSQQMQLIRLSHAEVVEYRRQETQIGWDRNRVAPGKSREIDPNAKSECLRADLQLKGTDAHLTFTCECGHEGLSGKMFMNHVGCVRCGAVYRCNNRLQAILLTDTEVAMLLQRAIVDENKTPLLLEVDED